MKNSQRTPNVKKQTKETLTVGDIALAAARYRTKAAELESDTKALRGIAPCPTGHAGCPPPMSYQEEIDGLKHDQKRYDDAVKDNALARQELNVAQGHTSAIDLQTACSIINRLNDMDKDPKRPYNEC